MNLIEFVNQLPLVKEWQANLDKRAKRQLVIGLSGSAKALVMAAAQQVSKKQTVIVVPNLYYSNQLADELRNIVEDVHLFPVDEVLSAEMAFASPEARAERVSTLQALSQGKNGIYVVPVAALRKYLPTVETWQANQLHWKIGSEVDLENLAQRLVLMGYERQTMVGKPGEFSMRGSIVDIYPLTTEYPVRVELFDVEVDSLRYFEPETQRSVENLKDVWITPTTDLVFSAQDLTQGAQNVNQLLQNRLAVTKEKEDYNFLNDYFGQLISSWEDGIPTEQAKYYTDLLYEEKVSLLDHFAKDALLFVDDYPRMMETHREMEREEAEWHTQKIEELRVFSEQTFGMNAHELIKNLNL